MKTTTAAVQIRWLIRRDMPEVLAIEQASFEYAWTEEDFLCCLRQRNCIGMVAEDKSGEVVGFMIYELHRERLRLLNFAVAEKARRARVGTQMAERLIDKLRQQGRREIRCEVRERNLPAQQFFRAMGFLAVGVLRDRYDDTPEDAYLMRYVLAGAAGASDPFAPANRVARYYDDAGV